MKTTNLAKAVMSFVLSAIAALLFETAVAPMFDMNPVNMAAGIMAIPFAVKLIALTINHPVSNAPTGMLFMAIQKEVWTDYIMENLFKDNTFIVYCFDESDSVLAGSVVHIPQAGAKPAVVKNRSSFPATTVQRTDTDITYTLDVYSTDPTHITNAEQNEVSYDKMNSVYGEHIEALKETYADDLLYKWVQSIPAGSILRTQGVSTQTALAPSATGDRNKFIKDDLRRAQALMNKQKIAKNDRYALIPTDMLSQLMEDADLLKRDNAKELNLPEGVIMRLYGFNIMERSDTTIFDNAATPAAKAPGAAAAATDNLAVICWQKNAVAKALGSIKVFENIGDATMYGDVISAEVKLGGRRRRKDSEGIVVIIQDPTPVTP